MIQGVFGKPIESLESATYLYDWYEYLRRYGLKVEGVFRVSGQHETIADLKARYNAGETIELDSEKEVGSTPSGVHIVADLLKSFFRKLPIKLISSEVVEGVAVIDQSEEEMKTKFTTVCSLFIYLHDHFFLTFKQLSQHFSTLFLFHCNYFDDCRC